MVVRSSVYAATGKSSFHWSRSREHAALSTISRRCRSTTLRSRRVPAAENALTTRSTLRNRSQSGATGIPRWSYIWRDTGCLVLMEGHLLLAEARAGQPSCEVRRGTDSCYGFGVLAGQRLGKFHD